MSDKNGRPLKPDLRGSKQKFQSLTTTAFKSKQSLDQGKGLAPYPKPGLSSLGKVSARRIPKPHIESKRTENFGEDPDVQLVPKDGGGWGKSAEAGGGSENGGKKDSFPGNSFPGTLHSNASVTSNKLWNDLNTVGSQRPRNYISNDFPTLTSEEKQPAPQENNSSFSLKPNRPSWKQGATGKFDEREETGPETSSSDASRQDSEYAHYPDMKPAFMKSKEQSMMAKTGGSASQHSGSQSRWKKDDEWKGTANKESKELDKIVELDKDAEGWAGATGEVDYNKKIVFSDEEDGTTDSGGSGRIDRRKMYNSGASTENFRFRGANKENFTPKVDRREDFFRTSKSNAMDNKYSSGQRKPENQAPFFQTSNDRNSEKDIMMIGGHPPPHMRKNNNDQRNGQMHDIKRRDLHSHGDMGNRNMRGNNDNWQDYDSRGLAFGSGSGHHVQESSRSNDYSSSNFSSSDNLSYRYNTGPLGSGNSGSHNVPPSSHQQGPPANYPSHQELLSGNNQIRRRTSSGQDYERKPPNDDKNMLHRSLTTNNESTLGKSTNKRTSFLEEPSRYPMDKSGHQQPSDSNIRSDMNLNFNSRPLNSGNASMGRNRYDSEESTGSGKAVDSNRNMPLAFKQFDPASMMKAQQQAPAPFFFPPPPPPQMMPGPMGQLTQQQMWQQYQMMMAATAARFPFQPHPFPMPPPQSLMPPAATAAPITSSESTNVASNEILPRPPPEGAASIAESPLNSSQASNMNNQKWPLKSGNCATQTASMPLSPTAIEDAGIMDNFSQAPPREEVKTKRVQRNKKVQLTDSSELESSEKLLEEPAMKILERPSKDKDVGKPVSAASFFHAPKQEEENSNNEDKPNLDSGKKSGNDYYGSDKKRFNPKSSSLDYESKESTSSPDDLSHRGHGYYEHYGDHHSKQSAKHFSDDNQGFYPRDQRLSDRRLEHSSSFDDDTYGSNYRSAPRRDRDRDASGSYNRGTIGDSCIGHSSGASSGGQPQIVREFRRGGRGMNFSRSGPSNYSSNAGGRDNRNREFVSHQRSHHQDYVDEKDEFEDDVPMRPRDERTLPPPVQPPSVGSSLGATGGSGSGSKKEQSDHEVRDLMSMEIKFDDLSEDNRQKLQHDFLGSGTRRSDISERYGKNFTSFASRGGARTNNNRRSTGSFDRTSKQESNDTKMKENTSASSHQSKKSPERFRPVEKQNSSSHSDPVSTAESTENSSISNDPKPMPSSSIINWNSETSASKNLFPNPSPPKEVEPESFASETEQHAPMKASPKMIVIDSEDGIDAEMGTRKSENDDQAPSEMNKRSDRTGASSRAAGSKGRGSSTGATWEIKSSTAPRSSTRGTNRSRGGSAGMASGSKQLRYYDRSTGSGYYDRSCYEYYRYYDGYYPSYPHQGYGSHFRSSGNEYRNMGNTSASAVYYAQTGQTANLKKLTRGGKSSTVSVTGSSGLKKGLTRDRKKVSGRGREHSAGSRSYEMNDKNYSANDQGNQEEWETASESSDFDKRDSKNDKVPVAGNETQVTTQFPTSNTKNDQRVGKGNMAKKSFSGQRPGADRGRNENSNGSNTASKPTNNNSNDAKSNKENVAKEKKNESSKSTSNAAEVAKEKEKEKSKERITHRKMPDISQYDMNRISGIVIIDQNMRPNIASDDDCADDTFQEVVSRRAKAQKAAANKKTTSTPASPSKEKAISPRVNKGGITKRSLKATQNSTNLKPSKHTSVGSNENRPPKNTNESNNRQVGNVANRNDGMHNIQNFDMVQHQLNNKRHKMETDRGIHSDPASSGKNSMITTPPPNKVGNAWEKPLQTLILQDNPLVPSLPMASTAKEIQNTRASERRTQIVPDESSWSMTHSTGNAFMPDATVSEVKNMQKVQAMPQQAQQQVRTSSAVAAPAAGSSTSAADSVSTADVPRQFTSQQYRMQIEAAAAASESPATVARFSSDQRNNEMSNTHSQVKERHQPQPIAPSASSSAAVSALVVPNQLKRNENKEQRLDSSVAAPGPAINRSMPSEDHPSMSFFTSCPGPTADLSSFLRHFETGGPEEVDASNSSENGIGNRNQGMSLNESAEDTSMKQQIEDNLRHMFADNKEDEYRDTQSNGGMSHHQAHSSGASGVTNNTELNMTAKSHVLSQVTSSASSLDHSSKVCTVKPQKQATIAVPFRNAISSVGAVAAPMSANPVGLGDYHQPSNIDLHSQLNIHSQSQSQNLYFDDHLSNYSYNTQNAAGGPFFDSANAFSDVTAAAVLAAQQQQAHGSAAPHQQFMGGGNQMVQTGQKPQTQAHAQAIGIAPQTAQSNSVASLGAGTWNNAAAAAAAHNQLFYGEQAAAPQSSHVGTAAAMAQNSSAAGPYQQATAAFNHHPITNNMGAQAAAAANFNSFGYSPLIGMTAPRGQQASGHPPTAFMAQAAPPQPNSFGHMINSNTLQSALSSTTFPSPQHPANAAFDHLNMGQFGTQTHQHPGGKAMSPQSHNASDFKHDFALSQFTFNDANLFNSVTSTFKQDQSPHSHFMSNYAVSKSNASQFMTGVSSFGGPGPNTNNTGAIQQSVNPNAAFTPGGSGSYLNKNMFGAAQPFSAPKPDSSMMQNAQKQFGFTSLPSALQGGSHFAGGPTQFHKPNSLQLPSNASNAPQSLLQAQPSSALFSGYPGSGSNVTRMPNPIQRPNTMYQRPSPRAPFVGNNVFNNPAAVAAASMNSSQQKVNSGNDRSSPSVGTHRPWSSADIGGVANSMQSKFHQTAFNLQAGNANGGNYSNDNSMSRIPNSSMVRPRNSYNSPQGMNLSSQGPMTRFPSPIQGSGIKRDVTAQGALNGSMKEEKLDSTGCIPMCNTSMAGESGGNSLFVSSEMTPIDSKKTLANVNTVEQKDLSASEMGGQQNMEESSLSSSGVSAIVNSTGSDAPASGGNSAVVVD